MTWSRNSFIGVSLTGIGGLLLVLVGLYVLYSMQATSSLGDLVIDRPQSLDQLLVPSAVVPSQGQTKAPKPAASLPQVELTADQLTADQLTADQLTADQLIPDQGTPATEEKTASLEGKPGDPLGAYALPGVVAPDPGTTYPLTSLTSSEGETIPAGGTGLRGVALRAFQGVDWLSLPETLEVLPRAQRIQIPAIDLDAEIVELNTTWVGESLVWESPRYVVGHHRGTVNPGEVGNTVLSGHISTPIRQQGAIFKNLPQIPALVKEGRIVDIILSTSEARYLYRVVATDYAEPEDVDLFRPTTEPSLTLITCVPDFVYSHRFLVSAILVGKAPHQ